jgi:hypothetical protein
MGWPKKQIPISGPLPRMNLRRKISVRLFMRGVALLVMLFFVLQALFNRSPTASSSVALFIDGGFTNFSGGPRRFAYVVITNHSNSDFRLYRCTGFWGTRPTRRFSSPTLGESFQLLTAGAFYRFPVEAPTNGTPWCGMVTLSPDGVCYRSADKVLAGLQNSRFELIKWFAEVVSPKVRSEDMFTETKSE